MSIRNWQALVNADWLQIMLNSGKISRIAIRKNRKLGAIGRKYAKAAFAVLFDLTDVGNVGNAKKSHHLFRKLFHKVIVSLLWIWEGFPISSREHST